MTPPNITSIGAVEKGLKRHSYVADRSLATSVFLSLKLHRPLFVEGEAGVGKTELAKVLASFLRRPLIRLQCYEGLDIHTAVYEWNYSRQMLQIRLQEATGKSRDEEAAQSIFAPEYLLKRPLLQAIDWQQGEAPILLVDELDRADQEFEALLLEVLSDFQITIPEVGTVRAKAPPAVIITSNRTREIHDALKRRCLYYWIQYPSFEKEYQIVQTKLPRVPNQLAYQAVSFVQQLRQLELYKRPGVAETLDWVSGLTRLNQKELTEAVIDETLGTLLKHQDDLEQARTSLTHGLLAGS